MSFNVGELVGYLRLDTSGVGQGIRQAQRDIRAGLAGMDGDADQAGRRVSGAFSRTFMAGIRQVGAGIAGAFAVGKIVDWFRGAIDAASSANEIFSKATVIFGRNADAMREWATGAVRNLGMSSAAAIDAAAGFGDMFLQLGFGELRAAEMSRSVVQLAADFGSFNNLGTEDVLERIAAGFRGEYDSLQKLIPNISAARVEQEAMAATGKKSAQALTAQEKAAAVLAIVTKDGSRAMGDFARTADSTANVQKQTSAAAQELAVKVGNMLLPAYTALVRFGRDQVIPFLSGTADVAHDAVVALGPLASAVGAVVSGFRELPAPLQSATIGLIAFLLLKDRLIGVGAAVGTMATTARGHLQSFGEALHYSGQAAERAGGGLRGFGVGVSTFVGGAGALRSAASGLLGVLGGPWGVAFMAAAAVVGHLVSGQAQARQRVQELTNSLDEQTGAITSNTRALVVKNLEERGVLENARKMGLSLDQVTDAALGNAEAMRHLNEQMARWGQAQSEAGVAQAKIVEPIHTVQYALGDEAERLAASAEGWKRKADAMGSSTTAQQQATRATSTGADVTKDAAQAVKDYYLAQQKLRDQLLDSRAANREYGAALDELKKSIKENGKTLDINTEKGRANEEALDKLRDASIAAAKAQLEQGVSVDIVAKTMEQRRAAFVEQATRLLGNKAAAEELATSLGFTRDKVLALASEVEKTPTAKTITFTVDAAQAMAELGRLRNAAQIKGAIHMAAAMEQRQAAAGLITSGGVRKMAAGDVTRNAIIMARTSPILWNEAPGGESYIPLHPSRRARSLAIWERTGQLLGAGGGESMPADGWRISGSLDIGGILVPLVDGRISRALDGAARERRYGAA